MVVVVVVVGDGVVRARPAAARSIVGVKSERQLEGEVAGGHESYDSAEGPWWTR